MHKPTFKPVSKGGNIRLRGTNQQTDTGLLFVPATYNDHNGIALKLEGIAVASFDLHNRSGGAAFVGLGARVPNRLWRAGQWDDSEGANAFVDDTTHAQDTTATNFALETTTADDGFLILSRVPFNCISIDVGTASVKGTTVARAVRYSNAAGSGWATAMTGTDLYIFDGRADDMATGENLIVFNTPHDWGRSSGLTGVPDGYYALNVRATDAPDTTAAVADAIELWDFPYIREAVADNTSYEFVPLEPLYFQHADALGALFGTASPQNRATVQVRSA